MILQLISLFLAYFGTLAGTALSAIAPEELKTGKIYFYRLQKIILSATVFFLSYFLLKPIFNEGIAITFGLVLFFLLFKVRFSSQIIFAAFPFVIFVFRNTEEFIIFLSLFFLYGLLFGSHETEQFVHKKNDRKLTANFKERSKKIMKRTNLFFVAFIVVTLLWFLV